MQANEKLLHKVNEFTVTVGSERKRIKAASVSGHRVLVGLEDERFDHIVKDTRREIVCPAGTGYMKNGKQGIYHRVPGGMYDMLRAKTHASRGERLDSEDMREKTQLTFDFISRLRTWTQIGDEGQDFTDDSLMKLAIDLDHPKRDEHKLTASQRYRKAAELRTKANERRMPMPAAFTAAAGAQHLDMRRDDVQAILKWVDPERLAVFGLVNGVHMRLDDAWRVWSPEAFEQPGHTVVLASRKPTTQSVKVMRDYLRPLYLGLREIKVRPLNGLADDAAVSIKTLVDKIMSASGSVDIGAEVAAVRAPLTIMRTVREIEMSTIGPLSMMLERWERLETRRHAAARQRVADACINLRTDFQFKAEFLSPGLQAKIMGEMLIAVLIASAVDVDPRMQLMQTKKMLKRLSASLT